MKRRMGFVSNSSSASFIVAKKGLSEDILSALRNHIQAAQEMKKTLSKEEQDYVFEYLDVDDVWNLVEDDRFLDFDVGMNNFPLNMFARKIGVPEKNIVEDTQFG